MHGYRLDGLVGRHARMLRGLGIYQQAVQRAGSQRRFAAIGQPGKQIPTRPRRANTPVDRAADIRQLGQAARAGV